MKTKLFLALSVLTAGLNANTVSAEETSRKIQEVENYSKVQPTRFESFKLAMKNAYNSASDKTAKGFHYTVDTAKAHPRVAGTIAAVVFAGLGFGAYKLVKNYFGKAVVKAEEPKKVEDKKASKAVTSVRKVSPRRK